MDFPYKIMHKTYAKLYEASGIIPSHRMPIPGSTLNTGIPDILRPKIWKMSMFADSSFELLILGKLQ